MIHFTINGFEDSKIKSFCLFPQSFSSAKIQIVLMFSFKFSKFLNLHACKNDTFVFTMGTSSLICILADEKLCGNKQKLLIFESLTDTLNFRTVCYYLINLINDPSSLKLQSRDQHLI
jgi:hypothetical protein